MSQFGPPSSNPPASGPRYWFRSDQGRVWGPFGLESVGRVDLGGGDLKARIAVAIDGQTFLPLREFPRVLEVLERAAATRPATVRTAPPTMSPMPGLAAIRNAFNPASSPGGQTMPPGGHTMPPGSRSIPPAQRTIPPSQKTIPPRTVTVPPRSPLFLGTEGPAPDGDVPPPPPPPKPRPVAAVVDDPGPPPEGTLEVFSPAALYARAAATQATGKLTLHAADGAYGLYFKKGTPERVDVPAPGASLARFLGARKVVAQDELDRALDLAGGPDAELVDALFALGLVPPQQLFPLLGEYGVQLLFRVLAIETGQFLWALGAPPPAGSFALGQRWELLCQWARALPAPVVRRRLGDRLFRAAYPSSGARATLGDLRLTPQEIRAASAFDGTQSLDQVARDVFAFADSELVYRTAYLLMEVGYLSFGPDLRRNVEVTASPQPVPSSGNHAAVPPPTPDPQAPKARPGSTSSASMRAVSQPIVTPPPPPPPPKAPTTVTAPDLDELPPPDPVEPKRPAAAPRPVPAPVAAPAKAAPPRPAVAGKPAAAAPARPVQAAPRPAPAGPRPVDLNQLREQVAAWRKFNHFEVLGVPQTASAVEIKAAYIGLAKQHHPDTVSDPALHELRSIKADLTARLNEAYQVLGETQERVKYIAQLQEGGAVDIGPILQAEEDFLRATILVKARKLVEAIDLLDQAILLNPNEPEFHAWRAFARFAMAKDKRPEYEPALAECARVIKASPQCVAAHLFTGQMAKIMGDAAKAERAFREVLSIEPNNIEARRELRLAGKS